MSNLFTRLQIEGWRQFSFVDLELHPQLTVLTGANGAGKTTLLNILGAHFGWHRQLLGTPWRMRNGVTKVISGPIKYLRRVGAPNETEQVSIGSISYSNGTTCQLTVPVGGQIQFGVAMPMQQAVKGVAIPSHRPVSNYQAVGAISTSGISAQQAFATYYSEAMQRSQGGGFGAGPMFRMKESLISMATFGEGNQFVQAQPQLLKTYLGFIEVLRKVLPPSLGFRTIEIRTPDVVLVTDTGDFLIDSVSGGVGSVIDLAWQIHTYHQDEPNFVVVIDEPENHLHPSMQRVLMPSFISAFPGVQFIVATHSPFVVTAVPDSIVHVLNYESAKNDTNPSVAPAKSVKSLKLEGANKGGSANEILRTVLGLDSTMPLWAEQRLDEIVRRFRGRIFTRQVLDDLAAELKGIGLGDALPEAVDAIVPNETQP